MRFSRYATAVVPEMAFLVLAEARRLKAAGKRVIELEIGDSPFPSTAAAKRAGIQAIEADQTHYCPSAGLPAFRSAAAAYLQREHGLPLGPDNVLVAPGAKPFEAFFCEAFLDPGDDVLVFSPYFPTYVPNIERFGGRVVLSDLKQERAFRPNLDDVERFLTAERRPRAIFLNSPHNPTGGVATDDDLRQLADLVRGRDVVVFCDEPYDQMVWSGRHASLLSQPGMLAQCVACYTMSKSFSMSGWRVGYAVSNPTCIDMLAKLVNTTLSCTNTIAQHAAAAALNEDAAESRRTMQEFRRKVTLLAESLDRLDGVTCPTPAGTFYTFANVQPICQRLGIASHGLALYLLQGADDSLGVACLGGECFGSAGAGFLRFSCAEPDEALLEAVAFLPTAWSRTDRVAAFLEKHPQFRTPN